jgi:hypothetical protein
MNRTLERAGTVATRPPDDAQETIAMLIGGNATDRERITTHTSRPKVGSATRVVAR